MIRTLGYIKTGPVTSFLFPLSYSVLLVEIPNEFISTASLIKHILFTVAMAHRKQDYIVYAPLPDASLFLPWFLIG